MSSEKMNSAILFTSYDFLMAQTSESQAFLPPIQALHLRLPAATRCTRSLHGRKPGGHWVRQCLHHDLAGGNGWFTTPWSSGRLLDFWPQKDWNGFRSCHEMPRCSLMFTIYIYIIIYIYINIYIYTNSLFYLLAVVILIIWRPLWPTPRQKSWFISMVRQGE